MHNVVISWLINMMVYVISYLVSYSKWQYIITFEIRCIETHDHKPSPDLYSLVSNMIQVRCNFCWYSGNKKCMYIMK